MSDEPQLYTFDGKPASHCGNIVFIKHVLTVLGGKATTFLVDGLSLSSVSASVLAFYCVAVVSHWVAVEGSSTKRGA